FARQQCGFRVFRGRGESILEQPDDIRHLFNVEVISQRLASPCGLPGRFREGSIFIDCMPRKLRCREVTLSNHHIDVKVVAQTTIQDESGTESVRGISYDSERLLRPLMSRVRNSIRFTDRRILLGSEAQNLIFWVRVTIGT